MLQLLSEFCISLHVLEPQGEIVVGQFQLRVLLAEGRDLFGELLSCQCLDVDHLQLLRFVFDAPVLIHVGQLPL